MFEKEPISSVSNSDPTFEDTPFHYSLAGKWASVVRALAIVESSETDNKLGDDGQAFGLLQQHPAFMYQWMNDLELASLLHASWSDVQILCCAAFLDHYTTEGYSLHTIVQIYNIGIGAWHRDKRNLDYLGRFMRALASFGGTGPVL